MADHETQPAPAEVWLNVRVRVEPVPYLTVLPAETFDDVPAYVREYVQRVLNNSYLTEQGVITSTVQFASNPAEMIDTSALAPRAETYELMRDLNPEKFARDFPHVAKPRDNGES